MGRERVPKHKQTKVCGTVVEVSDARLTGHPHPEFGEFRRSARRSASRRPGGPGGRHATSETVARERTLPKETRLRRRCGK